MLPLTSIYLYITICVVFDGSPFTLLVHTQWGWLLINLLLTAVLVNFLFIIIYLKSDICKHKD
jgi:uncharacterized membrane protein